MLQKSPFLNPDPLTCWSGPDNIDEVRVDGESIWAVFDNGSTIMQWPRVSQAHSLHVGPLSNWLMVLLNVNGFGRLSSQLLGYIIMRVQVEGVLGYNEDQVALVIPDPTDFGSRVPVTLGTPIINWIINMIKEGEIDELSASLNGSRISHLLASHWAELSIECEEAANQTMDLTNLKRLSRLWGRKRSMLFHQKSYKPVSGHVSG